MAAPTVIRYVQITVTSSNATLATAATAQDTAVTTAQATLIQTPPAGYQKGSLKISTPTLIYNGTVYAFSQSLIYETLSLT